MSVIPEKKYHKDVNDYTHGVTNGDLLGRYKSYIIGCVKNTHPKAKSEYLDELWRVASDRHKEIVELIYSEVEDEDFIDIINNSPVILLRFEDVNPSHYKKFIKPNIRKLKSYIKVHEKNQIIGDWHYSGYRDSYTYPNHRDFFYNIKPIKDSDVLRFVLDFQYNVSLLANSSASVLMESIANPDIGDELIKIMIEHGYKLSKNEGNILFALMKYDRDTLVKMFAEKGENVNITDKDGGSLLDYSLTKNKIQLSRFLIERGVNVNVGKGDKRPLHTALAMHRDSDMVFLLMDKVKDVNDYLKIAIWSDNLDYVKYLVKKGANVKHSLNYAVRIGDEDIINYILEKGADINNVENGKTPLNQVLSRIEYVDEYWGPGDNRVKDNRIDHDSYNMVMFLLKEGADPNIPNKGPKSPLGMTVRMLGYHFIDRKILKFLIRSLIENGADYSPYISGDHGKLIEKIASEVSEGEMINSLN